MSEPETYRFPDDGSFPNSRLPLLIYRGAAPTDAGAIEGLFGRNEWRNFWRNGIFNYHHYHSISHEVLGIAAGSAQVMFGGPNGRSLALGPGDVVAIPAGVGHRRESASRDLLVIGAYPGGANYDIMRGRLAEYDQAVKNIPRVPLPEFDPVAGRDGPLRRLWG